MTSLPGNPAAINAAATVFRASSTAHEDASQRVADLAVDGWGGDAATKFASSRTRLQEPAATLADDLEDVATALNGYADALTTAQQDYDAAVADWHAENDHLKDWPIDVFSRFRRQGAYDRAEDAMVDARDAAEVAAAAIQAATRDVDLSEPFVWFTNTPPPGVPVSGDLLGDGAFDHLDGVDQRDLGTCWLISGVLALMQTDAGDAFLRQNVVWDEAAGGYWVTLYGPEGPTKYLVKDVFEGYTAQGNGQPSIAALYEAAVAQHMTFTDLEGGYSYEGLALITGQDVERLPVTDPTAISTTATTLAAGGTAVGGIYDDVQDIPVSVTDPSGQTVTTTVDLVAPHAYAIERIDPNGTVWVRNPWGPGNSADGGQLIGLTQEQYTQYFDYMASVGAP